MSMRPIIEVKNLVVSYQANKPVLNDISFQVNAGEVFIILGGSGCGKTTLLNHMIGLYQPASGVIRFYGEDIVQAEGKARKAILREIGVMFQSGALFGSMNLLKNVRLPLEELTDLPDELMTEIALSKLTAVGLGDFANFLPAEISGGMQKRAAIARAMALDPKVLFLDEPSAGLDPITSANLDQLIKQLSSQLGITFVIVSHELPSIYAIADQVIMLHDGKIVATGKPEELRQSRTNQFVADFFNRRATQEGVHEGK